MIVVGFIIGGSLGFVVGAAWGSMFTRTRLAKHMRAQYVVTRRQS